ncbi:MAG: carbohydrate porin [Gemmatimonadetes bacterium]|nr:carbohydrate porin [Gemmatimonadota bacterium]MBK7714943.1 carbohydrate porin [Gemmatimonadota bacterium]MBK7924935.1 carbohydrate porin [Gemmatimonadota bacterium]MBK9693029.1 carbohydrate porin [Gemmatimonadota bacterium]MBP9199708.1 carbohydrate porin [Gemmatimonadales bacterium]
MFSHRWSLYLVAPLLSGPLAGQIEFAALTPAAALLDSTVGASSSVASAPERVVPLPWVRWAEATGGWGGVRPRLGAAGLVLEASYVYDLSGVARGGLRRGRAGRGLFSAGLSGDLEQLVGLPGASVFVGMQSQGGANGSALAGDFQAFSNIDAEHFHRLAEAWYEQRLAGDRVRIKAGQVDANSEFAVLEPAGEFLNASGGFSPTIYALPTYPEPTPSVSAFVRPTGWLGVSGGLFRGSLARSDRPDAPTGAAFVIGEAAAQWASGHLALGYWRHPGGYAERFAGGFAAAPSGFYLTADQRLSGTPGTEEQGPSGLVALAKFGWADDRVSEAGQHLMLGVVAEAPFGRGGEAAGLMVSHVDLSDDPAAGFAGDETAVELFYRLPAMGFLTLRPDLQLIVRPSGDVRVGNALVGTLRAEVAF